MTGLCAVPPSLPADPEGADAPLASPAPYYVAEYVPGERLVLERNRFYRGERPHHVTRFVANLAVDAGSAVDQVTSGNFDTVPGVNALALRSEELASGTASTGRGSGSSPDSAFACSTSTRAGRCSATTRS